MNGLVVMKHDDIFTDSMIIAEGTGNTSRAIYLLIEKYEKDISDFGRVSFKMTPIETKGGFQDSKVYELNEQQATFLMTLLRNNKTVVAFKKRLVQEFFRMRQALMQRQTNTWIESREQSKLTRKSETDVLKDFIEYAQMQGSTHSEKYYMIFSKLANKMANVNDRNMATILELNNLNLIESIVLKVVREEMSKGTHYKEIYKACDNRLGQFTRLAYLIA